MTAAAAQLTTHRSGSRVLRTAAVATLAVVATGLASLLLAAAILAAADGAGLDVHVPEPGPVPHPLVAPAGNDT